MTMILSAGLSGLVMFYFKDVIYNMDVSEYIRACGP